MEKEFPRIETTASGKPQIILAEDVSRRQFEKIAESLVKQLKATIESKAESVAESVWTINIDGVSYCLSWDDMICDISIFAWESSEGKSIGNILNRLKMNQNWNKSDNH